LPQASTTIDPSAAVAVGCGANESPAPSVPPAASEQRSGSPAGTRVSLGEIATGAMLVWAAGALLMLARLLRNGGCVVQLRRSSRPLEDARLWTLLQEIAARLGMRRAPLLLVSSRTVAPLAVGFGQGAVILPERLLGAVSDNELRDVLVHEVAHLRRGDQWIVLLQELAGALYWPIVSVHALNRELQRAREELCDNVVLAGRDAIRYGETLLHIAELLVKARPMRAAIGIIGGQGELERRIKGLIDPRRSTRTTIGRKASCLVVLLFVAAGALLSATRFAASAAPERDEPQPPARPPVATTGQPGKKAGEADSGRMIVLRGKVLGPGERPIAGARLSLAVDEWTDPIELGTSDVHGTYRFVVPEKTLRRTVSGSFQYQETQASLVATARGLGPGWSVLPDEKGGRYGKMKSEYAHDFHLSADHPIAGKVVDVRGKPVAGVVVAVDRIHSLTDGRWWKMIPAIKANDTNLMTGRQVDVNGWWAPIYPTAWKVIPPATTDAEGRFRITGVGGDRAIRLAVTGPGIRSSSVSVLTRGDADAFTQAIRKKHPRSRRLKGYFYPERKDAPEGDQGVLLFGPSPTIEVDPARTVAGVVRDASTGNPIAGVEINVAGHFGAGRATSDRQGRYRILRADDDNSISVYTSPEPGRYLTVVRRLNNTKGLGEIIADFDIPRGIVIQGRVLEAGSNRPLVSAPRQSYHDIGRGPLQTGWVSYFPLSTNKALRGTPTGLYFEGFPPNKMNYEVSVSIEPDGRFRMAVPPGPGVLLVRSSPGMPMFGGFGTWKEKDGLHRLFPYRCLASRAKNDGGPEGDAKTLPGFIDPIRVTDYHAYRVINPQGDPGTLDLTLSVPRAPARLLRFVGPDGRPIRSVKVQGLVPAPMAMTVILDGSEAEALALEPGKPRQVIAKSKDGKHVVRTFVSTEDPQPRTIQLGRAGSITGRIVDANGKPVTALLSHDQQARLAPDSDSIPQVRADAKGRFRIDALLPGVRYSGEIRGGAGDTEVLGKAFKDVVLRAGEVRDLGDIRIKASVKAKAGTDLRKE
jgi:beta-lactamase regulating signal transducer with metallopeptidase domain